MIFLLDITNKTFSHYLNYIVNGVMRPKFCNLNTSMREVKLKFYNDLTKITNFFKGYSLFKFSNSGLALDMALKFYTTSVLKWLKLKVRKFRRLSPVFVEVTVEKVVGGLFSPILNKINTEDVGWLLLKLFVTFC